MNETEVINHMLGSDNSIPTYQGIIAAAVAVLFFGSNFVPVKKFETGDGMFFQWVLCIAIWLTGLFVHLFTLDNTYNQFYPLAMLGGFIWATGNIAVVPIIKTIGLGQGLLIWGTTNMVAGWASGRFGLFGLHKETPDNAVLNYVGVVLCCISGILNLAVKTESQTTIQEHTMEGNGPLSVSSGDVINEHEDDEPILYSVPNTVNEQMAFKEDLTFLERLSPLRKRVLGMSLSAISGVAYGLNFVPVIYIQDNYPGASQKGQDYIFAHFCGILLTSSSYFIIYCAYMQNKPRVYPQAILPGIISGIMWAIADSSWFIANAVLSEAVSFPIVTAGPAIIAALWGILFKEIRGLRNFLVLGVMFAFTASGSVLTGLSK